MMHEQDLSLSTPVASANALERLLQHLLPNLIIRLYLPRGYLNLLTRLTGAATFLIGFIVYNWAHGGPGPYVVPTWRFHEQLFVPPMPPEPIGNILFFAAALACVCIACGVRSKWVIAIPVLVGAYFGCRDYWCIGSHFVVMLWTFLVALLLDNPKSARSPARRVIQISIFFCYFYSAVQKLLSPDFMSGYSLEAEMADGWSFNTFWKPILDLRGVPHWFWLSFAWVTIALELFLAFGLFLKRWRRWALALGISFHIGISVLLDVYISLFSLAMLIGYLAFIDKKSEPSQDETPAVASQSQNQEVVPQSQTQAANARYQPRTILAVAFVIVMALVPLRVYWPQDRPLNDVTMFDRTPWTFCMFLQRIDQNKVRITVKGKNTDWQEIKLEPKWRTKSASTDTEMYSICNWLFHTRPDVQAINVDIEYVINNGRWKQKKTLNATRENPGRIESVAVR